MSSALCTEFKGNLTKWCGAAPTPPDAMQAVEEAGLNCKLISQKESSAVIPLSFSLPPSPNVPIQSKRKIILAEVI